MKLYIALFIVYQMKESQESFRMFYCLKLKELFLKNKQVRDLRSPLQSTCQPKKNLIFQVKQISDEVFIFSQISAILLQKMQFLTSVLLNEMGSNQQGTHVLYVQGLFSADIFQQRFSDHQLLNNSLTFINSDASIVIRKECYELIIYTNSQKLIQFMMMDDELPDHIRSVKYRVSAEFKSLHLNKNIPFQTKILWKRNKNRAQTKTVTHHAGESVFNQTLTLEFSMYFDSNKNCFLEKHTEITPVISIEGKTKSGGSAKIDIAEPLNSNFGGINQSVEKRIPLIKCPDPDAYIDAIFYYELLDGEQGNPDMSVMNLSTQDSNISRLQFPSQSKIQQFQVPLTPVKRLHLIIDKMEMLVPKMRQRKFTLPSSSVAPSPQFNMQLQMIEGQNSRLKTTILTLEQKVTETELNWRNEKRELDKQNLDLEKMIDRKTREITEKVREIANMQQSLSKLQASVRNDDSTDVGASSNHSQYESMYQTLKVKYEQSQKELEELRPKVKDLSQTIQHIEIKNQSFDMDFAKEFGGQNEHNVDNQRIEQLQKEKNQLQERLVVTTNRMGQLFNRALEIGGAKLLDKLQTAIGLIQSLDA